MDHQVLVFKEEAARLQRNLQEELNAGWTIERADVVGKTIIYVMYKPQR